MLKPGPAPTFFKQVHLALMLMLLGLYSCMPSSSPTRLSQASTTDGTGTGESPTGTANYQEPTYPLTGNFIQEGSTQTQSSLALPLSFSDSFLIRGQSLSQYVRKLPNDTKYCLVGKFLIGGDDHFLLLTAKPKSYTDLIKKTTEYFLQVEPAEAASNQNDCINFNLSSALYENADNPSSSFSFLQLCEDCSTSVVSSSLKLFFINGEEVPTVSLGSVTLGVTRDAGSSAGSCGESSVCVARGFTCCVDSQCVKEKALRPSADVLDQAFLTAQEDVRLNPDHYLLYPQYYFVCSDSGSTTSGSTTGGTTGGTSEQAEYEAQVRLMEYRQLYQCLNKTNGEFAYCTVKFTEATAKIASGGLFTASTFGYYDDVNFTAMNRNLTGDNANNIVKVHYAGKTLYELGSTPLTGASFELRSNSTTESSNDDLDFAQVVKVTSALPANAKDDNLYLTYKVDGTCEKTGTTLAKCMKTFIYGSTDELSTTWHDETSFDFLLPAYADTSAGANLVVKIGGIIVTEDPLLTWTRGTSPNRISFKTSYPLFKNQSIEITYFVTSNVSKLLALRTIAQTEVNSMCNCGTAKCNLKPELNTSGAIVDYECVYPTTTTNPPANQTIYVSNKNVPHRYFDRNGVNYDSDYSSAPEQELLPFSYINSNVLQPSNTTGAYTGFNEIYGSFAKSGTYIAKPAKMVTVKKNQSYDLLSTDGAFSSCTTCGTDYYSSLQKIFPQNIGGKAGGYSPDNYASTRVNSTSLYRGDDLLFGRACFVPATMIPWTHSLGGTAEAQRQLRLSGQHFLFANGYNRDWYGFDYGSLIGSFDGVNWFSIGNQRRIKATTNRLYLAVNAYFGDVSVDSNFTVRVSETVSATTSFPDHDTETDGAECQKSHFCSTDNDCFRQVGYDYTCQSVSGISTSSPQFDANATETVGTVVKTISSIIGGTNGQAKRCVYRGRGAPCLNDLTLATGTTYNGSSLIGTLTCSPNNLCQPISKTSLKFNDRIARFANTPLAQNSDSDIVGLGARILGRPFDYYGVQKMQLNAFTSLEDNNVNGVCIPGKDIANSTRVFQLNQRSPTSRIETSDKIMGVGSTMSGLTTISSKYMNACPATDAAGVSMQIFDLSITDPLVGQFAIAQNLSSNLLDLSPLTALGIFSSTGGSKITNVGYQRNTCLRAPGASCFSDFECAPSANIASKASSANLSSLLNPAEVDFWEEGLVCGNPDFKNTQPGVLNPLFDVKKNACCREFGKTLTVYTQKDTTQHRWCEGTAVKVAGVNASITAYNRYSRVHTGYDKMTCDINQISTTKSFALSIFGATPENRWKQILAQYKTLDAVNQRTCCTQNWVRSFHSENGGGHAFSMTKLQTLDKGVFKNISWNQQNSTIITDTAFECNVDNYANSSCEIRSLTPAEEDKYLTWAGSFELLGIPQVAIKTEDEIYQLVDEDQNDNTGVRVPLAVVKVGDTLPTPVTDASDSTNVDFTDTSGNMHFSAASFSKFDLEAGGLKKIFSEEEFNCCIPSNQQVPSGTTAGQCCTGNLANNTGILRCCLPDFTDVTVYLNRYVSSEGRGLSDSAYDPATGYIKDPATVKSIIAQKNLCCSGSAMSGVAISRLPIPIEGGIYKPVDQLSTTRRFTYRTDAVDNNSESGSVGSIFDAGVKWNNHVYCVPDGFAE